MSWVERVAGRSDAEERSRARRIKQAKAIVDAATKLLVDTGESFTIQELVAEAGIALQTFYRYFPTKDELMLAVLENLIAESCVQLEVAIDSIPEPVEQFRFLTTAPLQWLKAGDYPRGRIVTQEHFRLHQQSPAEIAAAIQPFADLLAGVLRRGIAAGVFTSTAPDRDAALINQLTTASYHHYSFAELGDDADEVIDHFFRFCLAAVGGSVGSAPPDVGPAASRKNKKR